MRTIKEAKEARSKMLASRKEADKAAKEYRKVIREVTAYLIKTEKISQREVSRRLGISEGALRALLRKSGKSRKEYLNNE